MEVAPDMFRAPNVKGMQVVMHFLFSLLDEKDTKERFPTVTSNDRRQQAEFITGAMSVLRRLEALGAIPKLLLRKSLLTSAAGERLNYLLLFLAAHVLELEMQRRQYTVTTRSGRLSQIHSSQQMLNFELKDSDSPEVLFQTIHAMKVCTCQASTLTQAA